ncbi:MAG TPA: hypothetical protein VFW94_07835 [Candidatus Acidoferrales bacterium]|nr:hypothetical protein [Candidatus Acidoferrales bacterium]
MDKSIQTVILDFSLDLAEKSAGVHIGESITGQGEQHTKTYKDIKSN